MDQGGRVVWNFDADLGGFTRDVGTGAKTVATLTSAMKETEKAGDKALSTLSDAAKEISTDFNDAQAAISLIGGQFALAGAAVGEIAAKIGDDVLDLGKAFGDVLTDGISKAADKVSDFVGGLLDAISQTTVVQKTLEELSKAYDKLSEAVDSVVGRLKDAFNTVAGIGQSVANKVQSLFSALANKISSAFNQIGSAISTGLGAIQGVLSKVGNGLSDFANKLTAPIVNSRAFQVAISGAIAIGNAFQKTVGALSSAATVVAGRIQALAAPFGALVRALSPIAGLVGNVAGSLAKAGFTVATTSVKLLGDGFQYLGEKAVQAAGQVAEFVGQGITKLAKTGFDALEKSAAVAGGTLIALGTKGITSANQLQSLQLQMNGLTHSMDLGAKAIAGAYKYAQTAPFQLPDVAATTKTLIAYGQTVDDAIDNLKVLGNVSITTGIPLQDLGTIFGRVSAQGKLMGGDLTQLTQDGVAVLPALQKELGKTAQEVQQMASDGEISFGQFKTALASIVDPSILDQLTNTLPRQIDRLNGSIRILSNSFVGVGVDATNGFTQASNGIAAATTTFTKTLADTLRSPAVLASATQLGNSLVPLINNLTKVITPIIDAIAKVAQSFVNLGSFALPVIGLIIGAFGGLAQGIPVLGTLLGGLSTPFLIIAGLIGTLVAKSPELQKSLSDAFKSIGDVIKSLSPVFEQIGGLITQIFTSLGGAVAPLVGALADAFGEILKAVLPLIPPLLKLVVDIIQKVLVPIIPAVVTIIKVLATAFVQLFTAITPLLPIITQIFVTLLQKVLLPLLPFIINFVQILSTVFSSLLTAIIPLLPPLLGLVTILINALAPILPQLAQLFIQLVGALLPLLPPLIQLLTLILPPLTTLLTVFINVGASLAGIITELIIGALQVLIGTLSLVSQVIVGVIDFINRLVNIGVVQFNNLKKAIGDSVKGAIDFVASIPGKIKDVFNNTGSLLLDAGHKVIEGFINGVKDKFSDVKNTLGDLTSKLTSWKGPEDLDKRLLTPNGILIMQGFLKGLEGSYSGIRNSLQDFTQSLSSNVDLTVSPPSMPTATTMKADTPTFDPSSIGQTATATSGITVNQTNTINTPVDLDVIARDLAWRIKR